MDELSSLENENEFEANSTLSPNPFEELNYTGMYMESQDDIIGHFAVQALFCFIYVIIFILGIFGNVLVCYVVGRNRAMQTVTNFFITNLALADILLCSLAVPFTPLYTFLEEWIFGSVLCHLVPYAQGTSVYISSLTLTSIAIDRYFVIMHPFKPRMRITTCFCIVSAIWIVALLATVPYGVFLKYKIRDGKYVCEEAWPSEEARQIFSAFTSTMQFLLPFTIITISYVRVSLKLSDRARAKPGSKNSKKEAVDRERKRRTNRMLIAMVTIFGISWLPLSLINLMNDVDIHAADWEYYNLCFFAAHAIAMSSTCYNIIIYSWLNENFRKEFKQILPCFYSEGESGVGGLEQTVAGRSIRRNVGGSGKALQLQCNGNDTVEELMIPCSSKSLLSQAQNQSQNLAGNVNPGERMTGTNSTMMTGANKIYEQEASKNFEQTEPVAGPSVSAKYCSSTNQVEIHLPQGIEPVPTTNVLDRTEWA